MNKKTTLRMGLEYYKNLRIEDKTAFKYRVYHGIEHPDGASRIRRRTRWSRKKISLLVPILILPLAGFTFTVTRLVWSGQNFETGNYPSGPISKAANPEYPTTDLRLPGTEMHDLSTAKLLAKFPIREPREIRAWTKILSEGVIAPMHNYTGGSNHQLVLQDITHLPLFYVDIYTNNEGQRVSVTQQYDALETRALHNVDDGKLAKYSLGHVYDLGNNSLLLKGYGKNNLVYFLTGHLPEDFQNAKGATKEFENILIFHREQNSTITKIVIDEYGGVSPSVMQSFAHSYLNSPGDNIK